MLTVNGNALPPSDESVKHVPPTAKQPVVMLSPTLDVEVAEPAMFKPLSVVVPKPEFDTRNHGAVVDPTHSEKSSPAVEFTASLAEGVDVPIPSLPSGVNVDVAVPPK